MTRRLLGRGAVVAVAVTVTTAWAGPAGAAEPSAPEIAAKSAIAVQADTGAVLYAREASTRRPIASTTKLMTALLVLEHYKKLDEVVTTVPYQPTAGESVVYLRGGEQLTVADLLRALLLPSANDAAESLAVAVAGSSKAFVAAMNRRAKELGLTDTHYANPIGLDSKANYASAADLVALTLELRRYRFFRETVARDRLTLRTGAHERAIVNRNLLLDEDRAVNGVKTGHTTRAGYVLVGSATRDRVTVVTVVLGEPDERSRDQDSLALLRYGLALYRRVTPVVARRPVVSVGVKDQGDDRVELVAASSIDRVVRRDAAGSVTTAVRAPSKVSGPLPAGARLGTVEVRERGKVVDRAALVTAVSVPRASLLERTRALLGRTSTLVVLLALVICSLTLAAMRRRDVRRRGAEGANAQ